MPQTTKTFTNSTKRTSRKTTLTSVDELGVEEPYLNPDPTSAFMRFKGKYYKFDVNGDPYRFYPPGVKQPRSQTKPKR